MGDHVPNQSQTRAHKKNVGAVKTLAMHVEQLQKDRRKNLQTIDQEVLDAHKFLEQVLSNTGNSVTREEVFPNERRDRKSMAETTPDKYSRPTKSSIMRMEVKLRKSLAEARFKARSEEFFRQWREVFEHDLELDDWYLNQETEEENYRY